MNQLVIVKKGELVKYEEKPHKLVDKETAPITREEVRLPPIFVVMF